MIGVDSAMTGSTGAGSVQAPATPAPASTGETQSTGGSSSEATSAKTSDAPETLASKIAGLGKTSNKTVGDSASTTQTAAPSYTPNSKFKVLDKELEFEDWAKSAIKDAETEKKVRELHEKAYGLDSIKQDRQTLKTELGEAKERIASTDRALETVGQYARQKDWDSFFDALKIPKNDILQYALQLVQREQMPPEQKQAWEDQRRAQQQARYYQEQNQSLTQKTQSLEVQQLEFQLSQVMSKPDFSPVIDAYNAGMANPGAFKDFVVRIGQSYAASGNVISAEQAVTEAVRHLRAANPQIGAPVATTPVASQVVQPSSKQTLPNISGRGASPVRSAVKSLDDLKQRAREVNT
jgi:hypothetical protein